MLRVRELTKHFYFYRNPWHRLIDAVSAGRAGRAHVFPALEGVSFDLPRGRSLGIVGMNGAGKSTLLKLVAGTLCPTSGTIDAGGRVAALLELGVGFHPELTGRKNAFMNARFLGLDSSEAEERIEAIARFSELGDFFDRPLRTYSSGMIVRLGFSVAANVNADLLIVDEALAVGDVAFQQKCIRHLRGLPERGVTTLLVSHDAAAVRSLCDEALLLHAGRVVDRGRPAAVLERYNALLTGRLEETARASGGTEERVASPLRYGDGDAHITRIEMRDRDGHPLHGVEPGQEVELRVDVSFRAGLANPTIGILIRDRLGNDVFGTNTFHHAIDTGACPAGQSVTCSFRFAADLGPGDYTVSPSVHTGATHDQGCHDWIDRGLIFRVHPPARDQFVGTAFLRPRIVLERDPSGGGT
jgi:lipopolysaccharide transport system ATP-binding protein